MWNKIKNLFKKPSPKPEISPAQQALLGLAKRYGKGQEAWLLNEQTSMCLGCPIGLDPAKCQAENGKGLTLWLEERHVTHCTEGGSQFTYTARKGVKTVECPYMLQNTDLYVFEASVACDILHITHEQEYNFIGKSASSIIYEKDGQLWVGTYHKPMFSLQAVEPSWEAFTEIIERECDDQGALEAFFVTVEPYTEEIKYEKRIEDEATPQ